MIRIAQEITGTANPTVGGVAWPTTAFFVRDMKSGQAVQVFSPGQARSVAIELASEIGAGFYRGQLPVAWSAPLSDLARS